MNPQNIKDAIEMPRTAYLAFLPEPPLAGLNPHPAWSPLAKIETHDAGGYMKALGGHDDRSELEAIVQKEHEERIERLGCEEDIEEPDEIFEIKVHDDGRIEVFHPRPRYVLAEYTIAQVFEAYGMTLPAAATS